MHDIRYSSSRDEILVANPFAQSILTFKGDANGNQAPIRVIQGPKTGLTVPQYLAIDETHNEIFVPAESAVLVFPLTGSGDMAPVRTILGGPQNGWRVGGGIAVDPIHNFVVTDGTVVDSENGKMTSRGATVRDTVLIFDRSANGNTKPLRYIRGPRTGLKEIRQMQLYATGGWIVVVNIADGDVAEPEGAFVGVWSINDAGDVPPRWKIEAKPSNVLKKPRGVALNPKNKEIIVSDMRLNAVLTFYVPEMF